MIPAPARLLVTAAVTALATLAGAWVAPRIGWTDRPGGADAPRKRQGRPVPAVGGVAVLLGLACAPGVPWSGVAGAPEASELWGPWLPEPAWCAATLFLLLAVGTLDDRAGLRAGPKSLALVLALLPLAGGAAREHGVLEALGALALGFAAVNLLNTFDNADGALASLCALGFGGAAAHVSAACLGFLPFNLDAGRARNRQSGAPSAYLGDAGAFVLAYLVLVNPRSAGVLVLPFLDLARLALVRWRAGSRPWIGDRRHLAHRLEARGLSRPAVAVCQCAIAAPACVLVAVGCVRHDATPAALGVVATGLLFAFALRAAPAGAEPA